MTRLSIGFVVSFVLVAVGCSSDSRPGAPTDAGDTGGGPTTFTVTVGPGGGFTFSPNTITIKQGDIVQWTWGSGGHTVTSGTGCVGDGKFKSIGLGSTGIRFSFRFTGAGTFPYFCEEHCGTGMTGTVIVN